MEKLLAMLGAIGLTNVSLKNVQGSTIQDFQVTVKPDGTIQVLESDASKQYYNLVWETFRTWYQALVAADGDAADWPTPPVAPGQASLSGSLGSVGAALAPVLAAAGGPAGLAAAVPEILKAVSGLVQTATPAPAGPVSPLAPPAASK